MRLSHKNLRIHAHTILSRLKRNYTRTDADFVAWKTPLQLLVATVLSAQCTDKKVNAVSQQLFQKYHTAKDYALADQKILENEIYSLGFYHQKAKYLIGLGKMLVERFSGQIPQNREDLLTLPGVSFKTANLVLTKGFQQACGIAVDTHVRRLSPRLGLTKHSDPNKIAFDLEKLYLPKDYLDVNEYWILHGRKICKPKPLCGQCLLADICPSARKFFDRVDVKVVKEG